MDAPADCDFSERFRLQEVERGARSFFYFLVAICGLTADDPDTGEPTLGEYHRDLCAFLEGRAPHHPYNRAVICCFRGGAKSVTVMMYLLWRCLYIVNLSALILSNSADNAKKLHFLPLINILTSSRRAEYIRWLYQHRIPPNLEGSNSERLLLIRTDPLAEDTITYGGMETKLEGKHPLLVWIDDPEGADAEKTKSAIPNDASYALWQRVMFLPPYPTKAQIICTLTPWGRKPLAWRLRDQVNWKSEEDNAHTRIKFFWRPIRVNGMSVWPERFPEWFIDEALKDPLAKTQLLLERSGEQDSLFDMKAVTEAMYTWASPVKDAVLYKGFKFDPDKVGEDGFVRPEPVDVFLPLRKMRFMLHFDPLHRTEGKRRSSLTTERPATAAITVVGIAPDSHVFLMDYWLGKEDIYGQVRQLFRLYRLWMASKVTFESIGAQVWVSDLVDAQERSVPEWARPKSAGLLGPVASLPRMSTRLEEANKTTDSKERTWEALSPWVNYGTLHIREDQREALAQLEGVMSENSPCDIVDCLAQGPSVWRPLAADLAGREFQLRRNYVQTFVQSMGRAIAKTGFKSPGWR